jgi:hypothetical protein
VNRASRAPLTAPSAGPAGKAAGGATAPRSARVDATTTTTARGEAVASDERSGLSTTLRAVAAQPAQATHAQTHSSSGPPWSLLGAVLLLGALGAGTVAGVRRRRLAAQSTERDT